MHQIEQQLWPSTFIDETRRLRVIISELGEEMKCVKLVTLFSLSDASLLASRISKRCFNRQEIDHMYYLKSAVITINCNSVQTYQKSREFHKSRFSDRNRTIRQRIDNRHFRLGR